MDSATEIRKLYIYDSEFPDWVLQPEIWPTHCFSDTAVFYHKEDSLQDVRQLMMEREPCNIGMRRLYHSDQLQDKFGWTIGAYALSTKESLMPNLSVYCKATVRTETRGPIYVHVLNCIGCALDSPRQPDFQFCTTKERVLDFYKRMWRLALEAVKQLSKSKFQIYNVGGGAFAGEYSRTFIQELFEPAFLPLVPEFESLGIQILGYDFQLHRFTGGMIPDCLFEPSQDLENTVYMNAWDPWSLIGNGNEIDNSLDGFWGRSSNMSILGWLKTNPGMKFIGVV